MNPNDKTQFAKLRKAVMHSYTNALKQFRQIRVKNLEQIVGSNYSDHGAKQKIPVNLMAMGVEIHVQQIAASNPRVYITSDIPEKLGIANSIEMDANDLMEEMRFEKVLRRVVFDAILSVGIFKTGLDMNGEVYVDSVDLDDFVYDACATTFEKCGYMGNKIRMPLADIMDNPAFQNKDKLSKCVGDGLNKERKAEDMSKERSSFYDGEYEDYVEVWELYLPRERLIVTFPAEDGGGELPLRIVEYTGPVGGLYDTLYFSDIPNNAMPLPPAALWRDLHILENNIFRKLERQAERSKTITAFQNNATQDAEAIRRASDGEMVQVNNIDAVKEYKFGGVDRGDLAFAVLVRDWFSYFGGNLETLGGLGAVADTARQEMLVDSNSSKRMQKMQTMSEEAVSNVVEKIISYRFADPTLKRRLVKDVPSLGMKIPTELNAEMLRKEDIRDFKLQVVPYSMQKHTPETRLRRVMEIMNGLVAPMLPMIQQQGGQVSFPNLMSLVSKLSNMPEVNQLVTFDIKPPQAMGPQTEDIQKPDITSRTYTRQGSGGGQPGGQQNALAAFLAGGPQGNEPAMATGV